MIELCGCGKVAQYTKTNSEGENVWSCNKHSRCPNYHELKQQLHTSNQRLELYQRAVNSIDDYFEYRNDSARDRSVVYSILNDLTIALKKQMDSK